MTEESEGISAREARTDDGMVGRVLDCRYRLLRKLGQGGMGSVYLAEDQRLKIGVAIKVIVPKSGDTNQVGLQRFRFEAHAAARIQSDHVIRVSDFGVSDEASSPVAYIAMEYLQGEDLATYLERSMSMYGPLPWPRAKKLIIEIAYGLASVHEAGLVHRDMKPSNCFLTKGSQGREQVKIFDFGIAKSMETNSDQLTREGMIVGTMAYMAPEQAMGKKVDGRTDIYALGAILFQMLGGRPPFIASHWHELLAQIANAPPPHLSEIVDNRSLPPHIDTILLQALHKDPNRRFSTITAFVSAIKSLEPAPAHSHYPPSPVIESTDFFLNDPATTIVVSPQGPETENSPSIRTTTASKHPLKRWLWTSTIVVIAIVSGFLWQRDVPNLDSTPSASHDETKTKRLDTFAVREASLVPNSVFRIDPESTPRWYPATDTPLADSNGPSQPPGASNKSKFLAHNDSKSNPIPLLEPENSNPRDSKSSVLENSPDNKPFPARPPTQSTKAKSKQQLHNSLKTKINVSNKHTPKKPSSTGSESLEKKDPLPPKTTRYTKPQEVKQQLSSLLKKAAIDCRKLNPSSAGTQAQVIVEIGLNGKIQRFDPLISQSTGSIHNAAVCVGRILRRSLNINPRPGQVFRVNRIVKF